MHVDDEVSKSWRLNSPNCSTRNPQPDNSMKNIWHIIMSKTRYEKSCQEICSSQAMACGKQKPHRSDTPRKVKGWDWTILFRATSATVAITSLKRVSNSLPWIVWSLVALNQFGWRKCYIWCARLNVDADAVVSSFCAAATALGVAHARVSLLVKDMHLLLNPRIGNTPLKTNITLENPHVQ